MSNLTKFLTERAEKPKEKKVKINLGGKLLDFTIGKWYSPSKVSNKICSIITLPS